MLMKKILAAMLCLCLLLTGCDKSTVSDTAVSDAISAPEQTTAKTDMQTTASETATAEVTTAASKIHQQPTEFSMDNLSSVED